MTSCLCLEASQDHCEGGCVFWGLMAPVCMAHAALFPLAPTQHPLVPVPACLPTIRIGSSALIDHSCLFSSSFSARPQALCCLLYEQ